MNRKDYREEEDDEDVLEYAKYRPLKNWNKKSDKHDRRRDSYDWDE